MRVVVRDVLGRESVVTRPFFTNSHLLSKDLADWSIDVGRLRYNIATVNGDYRDWFTSGLYRRGVSDALTVEGRADVSRSLQNVGLGATLALPWQALGQVAAVTSRDDVQGRGSKMFFAIDQQALRSGYGVRVGMAERHYRDLGAGPTEVPYRREQAFNYRYIVNESGSLGLTAASIQAYDGGTINTSSLSYTLRVGERGSLTFGASHVNGTTASTIFTASLTLPLDSGKIVTASATRSSNQIDAYASVAQPIAGLTGTGWRALAGSRTNQAFAEGGVYHQAGNIYLAADASTSRQAQNVRLNAQGALVWIDDGMYAARRLQDSYALVEVKGYGDVGVGFQSGSLTRTDSDGRTLLTRLTPYQSNYVRLNANDLPFSAEIDNIEQITVPAWRSGVKVVFPVRSGRGALLRLAFEDGQPAVAGATVRIVGDDKEFFVARRGEAFVTGLQPSNRVQLSWKGKTCTFEVNLPPSLPDDIPRVGPLICVGVPR